MNQIAICESFVLEMGHMFIVSRKGGVHLVHNNYVYRSNMRRQGRELNKIYWECIYNRSTKCRGRLKSIGDNLIVTNGIYFCFVIHTHTYTFPSSTMRRLTSFVKIHF